MSKELKITNLKSFTGFENYIFTCENNPISWIKHGTAKISIAGLGKPTLPAVFDTVYFFSPKTQAQSLRLEIFE